MQKRYMSIWFRHLTTDWQTIRQPALATMPFVFSITDQGRKVVSAINKVAEDLGITKSITLADAKAIVPDLQAFDKNSVDENKILRTLGLWCIRYTPVVSTDPPDGLILDISGCSHLWGGERSYLAEVTLRLQRKGYEVHAAIADTIGTAYAVARFSTNYPIIEGGKQTQALLPLPPAALRLEPQILQRMHKLGLHTIGRFIGMPRTALRRRFGESLLLHLSQALGHERETLTPLQIPEPYQERLPCPNPVCTAESIEIAIKKLLGALCLRLQQEGKGLRGTVLQCFRVDGNIQQINISTTHPSHHCEHLFKLFLLKIPSIEPGLGIELFLLKASLIEKMPLQQESLWTKGSGLNNSHLAELLDRLAMKLGFDSFHRYLPDEHHWPERSIKTAASLLEKPTTTWNANRQRPTRLLSRPEPIEVTAPIPDYPPMTFRYRGKVHFIKKADGPERIEREWWTDPGEHRDYYQVEDEDGQRYWLFRSGHYAGEKSYQWFIHGFFA